MTLEQLKAQREALQAARFNGVLTVKAGDKWVTYKSDAELQSALGDLDRDRKSTRLNSSHIQKSRMPSSA